MANRNSDTENTMPSVGMVQQLLKRLHRRSITMWVNPEGRIIVWNSIALTPTERSFIEAIDDNWLKYILLTVPNERLGVTRMKLQKLKPKPLLVMPVGKTLVARAFGDGLPRPEVTIRKYVLPEVKHQAAPVVSRSSEPKRAA